MSTLDDEAACRGIPDAEGLARRSSGRRWPVRTCEVVRGRERARSIGLPHQPALDGSAGLAVAAVVLYHAAAADEVGWLEPYTRGGFLGVSAFFTLSGFLICSLLLAERSAHRQRVAAGVLAATRPTAAASGAAALRGGRAAHPVVGTQAQLASLPGDAWASLFYVANWRFVLDGADYASMFAGAPSPLRHLWSLSVEEQWYVVVPLAALALLRSAARGRSTGNAAGTTASTSRSGGIAGWPERSARRSWSCCWRPRWPVDRGDGGRLRRRMGQPCLHGNGDAPGGDGRRSPGRGAGGQHGGRSTQLRRGAASHAGPEPGGPAAAPGPAGLLGLHAAAVRLALPGRVDASRRGGRRPDRHGGATGRRVCAA